VQWVSACLRGSCAVLYLQEVDMASLMNFTPEQRPELQCPGMQALAEQVR